MWANKGWRGRYFPGSTPVGRELQAYSTWCNAVEGNTTFYGLPHQDTVKRWGDDTPEDFRFLFKVPRLITHDLRLRNAESEMERFLSLLAPLGVRSQPVSIQLPASFGPADLDTLAGFLHRWSQAHRLAVEVRDPVFCSGGSTERELNDVLAHNRVERVIMDTRAVFAGPCNTPEEREAFERKPRLPVRPVAIGAHPIVRFVGQSDGEANPKWWSKWVPKVAQWLQEGRSPMVFIHTPDNADAPVLARRFHNEVASLRPELAPLRTPIQPEQQLRLLD